MKKIKKLAFLLLVTAIAGVCMPVGGQGTAPGNNLYTLYPPVNFTGHEIDCNCYFHWETPQTPSGTTPPGIKGYIIRRAGVTVALLNNGDTSWTDYHFSPTTYSYTISTIYYLSYYGIPNPETGESPPAGPVMIPLLCPLPIPFAEGWNRGTFSYNKWLFPDGQSNWTTDTLTGNPVPAARFSGIPGLGNYRATLKSPLLDGKSWVCARIILEFEYHLAALDTTGSEKLVAGYYLDSTWHPAVEIHNRGQSGWIHQTVEVSETQGRIFRVGFLAAGLNSTLIDNWMVDNIQVYSQCKGVVNTGFSRNGKLVRLSWQPPPCDSLQAVTGYHIYRTGETGTPPFTRLTTSPVAGFAYTDTIPSTIVSGHFNYVITAVQRDQQYGTVLCEAPGDTLPVNYSLGIDTKGEAGLHLYPQPARDYLVIKSDIPVESCELFSIVRETVLLMQGEQQKEIRVPLSALPSGIYLASIKNASGTFVKKVAVMH
ncbi:MAG: T9SS type A sorting domain-containing protein [Bacteroidota bacterium]